MSDDSKDIAIKIARTGARTVGGIIVLILKIIGSLLLIALTTGIIFACIFAVYVKTNLSGNLEIRLDDFRMSLSSVICYIDPETNREVELVTLQSTEFRIWVDYKDIPKVMEEALVAIEDKNFYKHHGVDWYRTTGAFVNMFLSMKDTFGGSTITQQLIKNLTDEDDVTVRRKLTEIFRAMELEKNYKKDEIVELYMNLVYFGHGCYGIGAAAQYYFGKDVKDLSLAECAAIVGITNNPSIYSPYVSRETNKKRQELILDEMFRQGYILTESSLKAAKNEKLNFQRGESNEYQDIIYTWFEEAVINDVLKDLTEKLENPYSERMAKTMLYYGGYKIIATIDPKLQAMVDSIYKNLEEIPETTGTSKQLQSSIVLCDPYTGEIKAMSGGVGTKSANMLLNRATMTRRPPGSSLKPLSVYAPAIDYGLITPDTKFDDSPDVVLKGMPSYKPKNYDRGYDDIVTIRYAVRQSLNTISAQVLDELKPSVSYRFVKDTLGFELDAEDEGYAALALGQLNHGATVREMASGFTMFPNMGERMETYTYSKVYDASGTLILDNKPKATSAISETTAYWITDLLSDAVSNGTGRGAKLSNMPTAGKTGSTSDKRDRWFVGYTPYYVCAVWTGYDKPEEIVLKGSNANPAALIWNKVMELVHENLEPKDFVTPARTDLAPVEGIKTTEYTIRCVDLEGNVLQTKTQTLAVGRQMTDYAPEIEGYRCISGTYAVTDLTADASRNIAEFRYEPVEPEPPDDAEPGDTGTDDPGGEYVPPLIPAEPSDGSSGETPDGSTGETPDVPSEETPSEPSEAPPEEPPDSIEAGI